MLEINVLQNYFHITPDFLLGVLKTIFSFVIYKSLLI